MIRKLREFLQKLINARFNYDLARAAKNASKLVSDHHGTVICEYCRGWLPKNEAAIVYDTEKNRVEYSHEACWAANNPVCDGPIVPKER